MQVGALLRGWCCNPSEGEGGLLDEYTLAEGGAGGDEAEEGARRRIGPEAHTHEGRAALLRSEVRSVP